MKKFSVLSKALLAGVTLFTLGGTAAVSAASWTVTSEDVGAWGKWSSWGSPNVKQSIDNYASFNGDATPNALGYNVWLMDYRKKAMSNTVSLVKDHTQYAGNNSASKGYNYWADVRSSGMERHDSHVKLHFSSDRI